MITELRVSGFRILNDFVWYPKNGVNILVGANSSGKSTVLDAIELVIRGSLHGISARRALSPDWFNKQCVTDFFNSLESPSGISAIPEIKIIATFADDPKLARITGCCGPDGRVNNAPGVYLTYRVPNDLHLEFLEECRKLLKLGEPFAIPTDYYQYEWRVFQGDSIMRRPVGVSCSRVDTQAEPYSKAADAYAKSCVIDELDDDKIREVSGSFRRVASEVDKKVLAGIVVGHTGRAVLGLQMDRSPRSDWTNSIVLHRDGLPLHALGSAEQSLTKCAISLQNTASESILLFEEPECHLSHTSLNELIDTIDEVVGGNRQAFIATHSPYVLNRLGLDNLSLMSGGNSPKRLLSLSDDTARYFRRLSGYDTLRVILANKSVLVEGPTDEMVFDWAFLKERGVLPRSKGIDVIECGTQHKRFLELASLLEKSGIAALRDNDDRDPDYWIELAKPFLSAGRKFFCGDPAGGKTIEPQMISANVDRLHVLAESLKNPNGKGPAHTREELESYMTNNKTEWGLRLLDADTKLSKQLLAPSYILDAINFIDPRACGRPNE